MVIKFLKISQFHIISLQCFTVYCKDVNKIPPTTSYLIKLYICYWTQEYFYQNFKIINTKMLNCGFKHIQLLVIFIIRTVISVQLCCWHCFVNKQPNVNSNMCTNMHLIQFFRAFTYYICTSVFFCCIVQFRIQWVLTCLVQYHRYNTMSILQN